MIGVFCWAVPVEVVCCDAIYFPLHSVHEKFFFCGAPYSLLKTHRVFFTWKRKAMEGKTWHGYKFTVSHRIRFLCGSVLTDNSVTCTLLGLLSHQWQQTSSNFKGNLMGLQKSLGVHQFPTNIGLILKFCSPEGWREANSILRTPKY
jgi:hypothetical protein